MFSAVFWRFSVPFWRFTFRLSFLVNSVCLLVFAVVLHRDELAEHGLTFERYLLTQHIVLESVLAADSMESDSIGGLESSVDSAHRDPNFVPSALEPDELQSEFDSEDDFADLERRIVDAEQDQERKQRTQLLNPFLYHTHADEMGFDYLRLWNECTYVVPTKNVKDIVASMSTHEMSQQIDAAAIENPLPNGVFEELEREGRFGISSEFEVGRAFWDSFGEAARDIVTSWDMEVDEMVDVGPNGGPNSLLEKDKNSREPLRLAKEPFGTLLKKLIFHLYDESDSVGIGIRNREEPWFPSLRLSQSIDLLLNSLKYIREESEIQDIRKKELVMMEKRWDRAMRFLAFDQDIGVSEKFSESASESKSAAAAESGADQEQPALLLLGDPNDVGTPGIATTPDSPVNPDSAGRPDSPDKPDSPVKPEKHHRVLAIILSDMIATEAFCSSFAPHSVISKITFPEPEGTRLREFSQIVGGPLGLLQSMYPGTANLQEYAKGNSQEENVTAVTSVQSVGNVDKSVDKSLRFLKGILDLGLEKARQDSSLPGETTDKPNNLLRSTLAHEDHPIVNPLRNSLRRIEPREEPDQNMRNMVSEKKRREEEMKRREEEMKRREEEKKRREDEMNDNVIAVMSAWWKFWNFEQKKDDSVVKRLTELFDDPLFASRQQQFCLRESLFASQSDSTHQILGEEKAKKGFQQETEKTGAKDKNSSVPKPQDSHDPSNRFPKSFNPWEVKAMNKLVEKLGQTRERAQIFMVQLKTGKAIVRRELEEQTQKKKSIELKRKTILRDFYVTHVKSLWEDLVLRSDEYRALSQTYGQIRKVLNTADGMGISVQEQRKIVDELREEMPFEMKGPRSLLWGGGLRDHHGGGHDASDDPRMVDMSNGAIDDPSSLRGTNDPSSLRGPVFTSETGETMSTGDVVEMDDKAYMVVDMRQEFKPQEFENTYRTALSQRLKKERVSRQRSSMGAEETGIEVDLGSGQKTKNKGGEKNAGRHKYGGGHKNGGDREKADDEMGKSDKTAEESDEDVTYPPSDLMQALRGLSRKKGKPSDKELRDTLLRVYRGKDALGREDMIQTMEGWHRRMQKEADEERPNEKRTATSRREPDARRVTGGEILPAEKESHLLAWQAAQAADDVLSQVEKGEWPINIDDDKIMGALAGLQSRTKQKPSDAEIMETLHEVYKGKDEAGRAEMMETLEGWQRTSQGWRKAPPWKIQQPEIQQPEQTGRSDAASNPTGSTRSRSGQTHHGEGRTVTPSPKQLPRSANSDDQKKMRISTDVSDTKAVITFGDHGPQQSHILEGPWHSDHDRVQLRALTGAQDDARERLSGKQFLESMNAQMNSKPVTDFFAQWQDEALFHLQEAAVDILLWSPEISEEPFLSQGGPDTVASGSSTRGRHTTGQSTNSATVSRLSQGKTSSSAAETSSGDQSASVAGQKTSDSKKHPESKSNKYTVTEKKTWLEAVNAGTNGVRFAQTLKLTNCDTKKTDFSRGAIPSLCPRFQPVFANLKLDTKTHLLEKNRKTKGVSSFVERSIHFIQTSVARELATAVSAILAGDIKMKPSQRNEVYYEEKVYEERRQIQVYDSEEGVSEHHRDANGQMCAESENFSDEMDIDVWSDQMEIFDKFTEDSKTLKTAQNLSESVEKGTTSPPGTTARSSARDEKGTKFTGQDAVKAATACVELHGKCQDLVARASAIALRKEKKIKKKEAIKFRVTTARDLQQFVGNLLSADEEFFRKLKHVWKTRKEDILAVARLNFIEGSTASAGQAAAPTPIAGQAERAFIAKKSSWFQEVEVSESETQGDRKEDKEDTKEDTVNVPHDGGPHDGGPHHSGTHQSRHRTEDENVMNKLVITREGIDIIQYLINHLAPWDIPETLSRIQGTTFVLVKSCPRKNRAAEDHPPNFPDQNCSHDDPNFLQILGVTWDEAASEKTVEPQGPVEFKTVEIPDLSSAASAASGTDSLKQPPTKTKRCSMWQASAVAEIVFRILLTLSSEKRIRNDFQGSHIRHREATEKILSRYLTVVSEPQNHFENTGPVAEARLEAGEKVRALNTLIWLIPLLKDLRKWKTELTFFQKTGCPICNERLNLFDPQKKGMGRHWELCCSHLPSGSHLPPGVGPVSESAITRPAALAAAAETEDLLDMPDDVSDTKKKKKHQPQKFQITNECWKTFGEQAHWMHKACMEAFQYRARQEHAKNFPKAKKDAPLPMGCSFCPVCKTETPFDAPTYSCSDHVIERRDKFLEFSARVIAEEAAVSEIESLLPSSVLPRGDRWATKGKTLQISTKNTEDADSTLRVNQDRRPLPAPVSNKSVIAREVQNNLLIQAEKELLLTKKNAAGKDSAKGQQGHSTTSHASVQSSHKRSHQQTSSAQRANKFSTQGLSDPPNNDWGVDAGLEFINFHLDMAEEEMAFWQDDFLEELTNSNNLPTETQGVGMGQAFVAFNNQINDLIIETGLAEVSHLQEQYFRAESSGDSDLVRDNNESSGESDLLDSDSDSIPVTQEDSMMVDSTMEGHAPEKDSQGLPSRVQGSGAASVTGHGGPASVIGHGGQCRNIPRHESARRNFTLSAGFQSLVLFFFGTRMVFNTTPDSTVAISSAKKTARSCTGRRDLSFTDRLLKDGQKSMTKSRAIPANVTTLTKSKAIPSKVTLRHKHDRLGLDIRSHLLHSIYGSPNSRLLHEHFVEEWTAQARIDYFSIFRFFGSTNPFGVDSGVTGYHRSEESRSSEEPRSEPSKANGGPGIQTEEGEYSADKTLTVSMTQKTVNTEEVQMGLETTDMPRRMSMDHDQKETTQQAATMVDPKTSQVSSRSDTDAEGSSDTQGAEGSSKDNSGAEGSSKDNSDAIVRLTSLIFIGDNPRLGDPEVLKEKIVPVDVKPGVVSYLLNIRALDLFLLRYKRDVLRYHFPLLGRSCPLCMESVESDVLKDCMNPEDDEDAMMMKGGHHSHRETRLSLDRKKTVHLQKTTVHNCLQKKTVHNCLQKKTDIGGAQAAEGESDTEGHAAFDTEGFELVDWDDAAAAPDAIEIISKSKSHESESRGGRSQDLTGTTGGGGAHKPSRHEKPSRRKKEGDKKEGDKKDETTQKLSKTARKNAKRRGMMGKSENLTENEELLEPAGSNLTGGGASSSLAKKHQADDGQNIDSMTDSSLLKLRCCDQGFMCAKCFQATKDPGKIRGLFPTVDCVEPISNEQYLRSYTCCQKMFYTQGMLKKYHHDDDDVSNGDNDMSKQNVFKQNVSSQGSGSRKGRSLEEIIRYVEEANGWLEEVWTTVESTDYLLKERPSEISTVREAIIDIADLEEQMAGIHEMNRELEMRQQLFEGHREDIKENDHTMKSDQKNSDDKLKNENEKTFKRTIREAQRKFVFSLREQVERQIEKLIYVRNFVVVNYRGSLWNLILDGVYTGTNGFSSEAAAHAAGILYGADTASNGFSSGVDRANGFSSGVDQANGFSSGVDRANGFSSGVDRANGLSSGVDRANGFSSGADQANGFSSGAAPANAFSSEEEMFRRASCHPSAARPSAARPGAVRPSAARPSAAREGGTAVRETVLAPRELSVSDYECIMSESDNAAAVAQTGTSTETSMIRRNTEVPSEETSMIRRMQEAIQDQRQFYPWHDQRSAHASTHRNKDKSLPVSVLPKVRKLPELAPDSDSSDNQYTNGYSPQPYTPIEYNQTAFTRQDSRAETLRNALHEHMIGGGRREPDHMIGGGRTESDHMIGGGRREPDHMIGGGRREPDHVGARPETTERTETTSPVFLSPRNEPVNESPRNEPVNEPVDGFLEQVQQRLSQLMH